MSVKNFGLPYTGSKSRIASWLMEMLPTCDNFVDVFAGGCAVSHAVILAGKAKVISMNDIKGDVIQLFLDALHGELKKYDPYSWIDRATFFEHKDSNPFIRLVYSFGNNGQDYLYSREIEDYKHAVHLALTEDDWSSFFVLCSELAERCKTELQKYPINNDDYSSSIKIRHLKFQKKCCEVLREISNNNWNADCIQQNPFYRTSKKEWISHGKVGSKIVGACGNQELFNTTRIQSIHADCFIERTQKIESIQILQNFDRIKRIQHLEAVNRIKTINDNDIINFPIINKSSMDYRLLDIPNNSVVFCDPPYKGSDVRYNNITFDYKEFYEWCLEKAKHNDVFVTEYNIDHPHFQLIGEKGRQISLNGVGSKGMKVEKLYKVIP